MKFFKKFAAVLIAMAVFTVGNIGIMPIDAVENFMLSVKAADSDIVASGECGADGDNLTWTLDSEGTLTISGEGEMKWYSSSYQPSWNYYPSSPNIINIIISNGVTSIGDFAFFECQSLTSITIPDSVRSIGENAFSFCDNLSSVINTDGVRSIGKGAFSCCSNLTSITIPDSVTSIESITFYGCDSLTSITIPNSVTSIGDYAFMGCDSLTDVYYSGSEEEWNSITIGSENEKLYDSDVTIHYNYKLPDSEKQGVYQFFNMPLSWERAKEYCESLNGHLVVINSAEEQAVIEAQIPNISKNCYWIGAYLENDEWKWVTDEPFDYENWGENLPDNNLALENYAQMYGKEWAGGAGTKYKGEWNDVSGVGADYANDFYAKDNFGFICEWEDGDRELTGVIDFDVMQVAEFIANNPDYYLTSNTDTEITTAKKAAITDPSVTDYLWWKDILGQNDNDYNAELAIEAIVAELVVSDDVVQGIEEAAEQAAEQAMNETLLMFAESTELFGIEGDELEGLLNLVKGIEGGAVGVEFAAERSAWLSNFFKYADLTTLTAQLEVMSKNIELVGILYKAVIGVATAPEEVYNLYVSSYAYHAANESFKDSLKLLNDYVQAEAAIYIGEDDYSQRVRYVAKQFENCYQRLIDTSDDKYTQYFKTVCSDAVGNAIMDLTYEATTQLIICCVTLACPQLGAALETLKLTLEIGMNVWEALSEVDERALERDMFLNMIIFSDAIGKAMNDTRSGFPAVVLTVMDKHAIEMYQCGIKFYQKINNMMLEHAQMYLIMLRDDVINTYADDIIELYVGMYGEERIWSEYGTFSSELHSMYASGVQGGYYVVDEMQKTVINEFLSIIPKLENKQNRAKFHPLSAVNIIEAGIHAVYAIHCPVDITITKNGTAIAEVKNDVLTVIDETSGISIRLIRTEKNELASKFVMLPKGYELQITGNGMGTMSLEKAIIENGSVIELSNLEEIPVTAGSVYNEVIEGNRTVALECDLDNDGVIDQTVNAIEEVDAMLGDVNEDGMVDSSDASLVLAEYAKIQTGGAGEFTNIQYKAADVNNDNVVDSSDASKILSYYAMVSTGKKPTWD